MRGVVAAGHPLTAQAGADVLRDGGNAVDAAVAAVLMSFVAESPLTGPGAGGFMLVHTAGGESHLLDFFVAAPGRGLAAPQPAPLVPIDVTFSEDAVQRFNCGPSSVGMHGNPAGMAYALRRFGTVSLSDLVAKPAEAARRGVEVIPMQAFLFIVLGPIFRSTPETSAVYEPEGRPLRAGEQIVLTELGDLLERLGAEGPGFLYDGDVGHAVSDWVLERGGLVTREDLAAYEVVEREPTRAGFRGREVLTNPPPSSGGILIADALELLDRIDRPGDVRALAEVVASTNRARDADFLEGLRERELRVALPGAREAGRRGSRDQGRPGIHHPHLGDGRKGQLRQRHLLERVVLRSLGAGHRHAPQQHARRGGPQHAGLSPPPAWSRVPSMMAPTVVLRDGAPEIALGSAGSNRIRSAILQTVAGVIDRGDDVQAAVDAPRLHVEQELVDHEPGVDERALESLRQAGWRLRPFAERNLYFGGVQAVAREDGAGELRGAGDPRRGGVAATAD